MPSLQESVPGHATEMLGVSVLFVVLCFLGPLSWVHASILLGLLALGLAREVRRQVYGVAVEAEEEFERVLGLPTQRRMIAFFIAVGVEGLPLGAELAESERLAGGET